MQVLKIGKAYLTLRQLIKVSPNMKIIQVVVAGQDPESRHGKIMGNQYAMDVNDVTESNEQDPHV